MSVCLCGPSADSILELCAQEGRELVPATPDPASFVANPREVAALLGSLADTLPKPVSVLLTNADARRSEARGLACHVWRGPLPKGSLFAVEEGLYVTSPELTLLLQAGQLHQAQLCQMLGRYLGTWTPDPNSPTGQAERAPLTTLERLSCYLDEMGNVRGAGNLRLAMAYTCEGAASAPETTLQLVLCLPPELHGFGLPLPTLNYEVELSPRGRRMALKGTIRIDLCWRQWHFGLEHQGEEHSKTMGQDYARWLAARDAGFELWFVAKEQLASAVQMDFIGREVAKRFGVDVDDALWPTEGELQDLLDVLSGRRHPKPVSYRELRRRQVAVKAYARQRAKAVGHEPQL